ERSMLRLSQLSNATIESTDGQRIGSVEHVILDVDQGNAAFVLAATDTAGRTERPEADADKDAGDRSGRTTVGGKELAVIPWRAVEAKMQDRTTGTEVGAKDHCKLTVALEQSDLT